MRTIYGGPNDRGTRPNRRKTPREAKKSARAKAKAASARTFFHFKTISKTFEATSKRCRFFPPRNANLALSPKKTTNTPQREHTELTRNLRDPCHSLSLFTCLESRKSKCTGIVRLSIGFVSTLVHALAHCLEIRAASTSLKFAWVRSVGSGSGSGSGWG